DVIPASASPLTPMTRLAPSIRVFVSPHERVSNDSHIAAVASRDKLAPLIIPPRDDSARPAARRGGVSRAALAAAVFVALAQVASPSLAPMTPRRAAAPTKTASTNGKKATANSAAPLAGQSSKPTAVSKNAQRPLAVSSATRPVSSAHAALPVTVVAHGGSG